jgi:hypothetical protein
MCRVFVALGEATYILKDNGGGVHSRHTQLHGYGWAAWCANIAHEEDADIVREAKALLDRVDSDALAVLHLCSGGTVRAAVARLLEAVVAACAASADPIPAFRAAALNAAARRLEGGAPRRVHRALRIFAGLRETFARANAATAAAVLRDDPKRKAGPSYCNA